MDRKVSIVFGILTVLGIIGIIFVTYLSMGLVDVKISEVLEENGGKLLSLVGVVGAGIARDENNRIVGISIYVDDYLVDREEIPDQIGGFKIYIKRFEETSDYERKQMIIRNIYFHLLNVIVDKSVYRPNETLIILIKNLSNETFTFGDSVYGAYFERWDGESWKFYAGMISLQVITNLNPKGKAWLTYELAEKPFSPGRYRIVSRGWIKHEGKTIRIWGYVEFTVQ